MLKIGVIADDFTGATDIASFLVENGMPTVQINDVPTRTQPEGCDAVVISLKTRSCLRSRHVKNWRHCR
ncbi:hypothetical protein LB58_01270 [Salmonella enterica]|nr:hypothetical protein [Salmonella enterica]